jgi:Concanavalin A-like lectin/glucanases superfamily
VVAIPAEHRPKLSKIQFGYNVFGFMCRTFNGTSFEFYFVTASGASVSWTQAAAGVVAAVWQAMAIAKTSAGTLNFYIDGILKATTTPADSTFKATTGASPFYINPGFAGGDAFFSWMRISKGTDRGYNGASYAVPMLPLPHHA